MTGPSQIEMWTEHANLSVPKPSDLEIDGMQIDLEKEEIRVYAAEVTIAKLPLEEAIDALNERWRTREDRNGEPLDDWDWDPETGEVN